MNDRRDYAAIVQANIASMRLCADFAVVHTTEGAESREHSYKRSIVQAMVAPCYRWTSGPVCMSMRTHRGCLYGRDSEAELTWLKPKCSMNDRCDRAAVVQVSPVCIRLCAYFAVEHTAV